MTLKEWETKWATGIVEDVPGKLANVRGNPMIEVQMERHVAPIGEFIHAYINHLNAPWWRRGPSWKLVEKWMREKLDNMGTLRWHWR